MTRLTIGVLAHNEEAIIGNLIGDLKNQSVVRNPAAGLDIHLCIVANGCTDGTVETSRSCLADASFPDHVQWDVFDLKPPSKTNAWNVFVHDISPEDSDVLLFMDSDIRLPQPDIIERSLQELHTNRSAWIVSDEPKNVFPPGSGWSVTRFLSERFGRKPGRGKASLCGQFYCARASRIREITLPTGLLSQDGFIRAMVLTSALTEPEQIERISILPNAFHLHPAYTTVSSRFRYEKRQMMSTTVYNYIYALLNDMPKSLSDRMAEIRRLNRTDPAWVAKLVRENCRDRTFVVPLDFAFRRARRLRPFTLAKITRLIAVIPALAFDILVAWRASSELRQNAIGDVEANQGRFKIRGPTA
ncbi:glycosyltransferase family A protein [Roseovarius aestuariivivens]|uniref:glycosyltransferase family A protein n=1 Tax=Roseovarius aestuariivivens TaxID=1888910 RepID=UPI00108205F8|nr:glycosyltransferase family 2 protein [Roseovarius aestuariivivens]